jgi:hypothetical protein
MSNGRKMWQRNNLDKASSPYLRQHAGNPIWWQEWNRETLGHAVAENKPLLVSVGYATCHWCHVMAAGAFSDPETANYLNDNFISIKVDREQPKCVVAGDFRIPTCDNTGQLALYREALHSPGAALPSLLPHH